MQTVRPEVGTKVVAFFSGREYEATVCHYGRSEPHIRFRLKNGRVIQGRATILPKGVSTAVTYKGFLAQMAE